MQYDFTKLADRKNDHTRKWNRNLIEEKYTIGNKTLIPMWIADMDFETPTFINEHLMEIIRKKSYCYSYTYDEFYQAVIYWYKIKKDINIMKEWITLTYGTVSTMHYVVQAFTEIQDNVLIMTPIYDPFRYSVENNQRKIVNVPLVDTGEHYEIDFEQLERVMQSTSIKLFFFCNPHNPSGRVWTKKELQKVVKLCEKYEILFVSDEVHSDVVFTPFVSALDLEYKDDNFIVLTSANKSFNFGGLKTSYSIIKNKKINKIFKQQLLKNAITSPNLFGVAAIVAAYSDEGINWLKQSQAYILQNYEILKKFIDNHENYVSLHDMESSYLAWIDISKTGLSSQTFVENLAEKESVVVEPGTNFATGGDGYIRMNLGTSEEIITEVLARLHNFLNR